MNMCHWRQITSIGMGMLFEHQDGAKQLLLGLIGTDCMERTESRRFIDSRGCKNDGLMAHRLKESHVGKHYAHIGKVMKIAFGMVCLKFGKRCVRVDFNHRHYRLQ